MWAGGGSSRGGPDLTRGLDGEMLEGMDFKKQVRKPKVQPTDEAIIDGVTHDSIAEFVKSSNERTIAQRHKEPSSWFRRLFRK